MGHVRQYQAASRVDESPANFEEAHAFARHLVLQFVQHVAWAFRRVDGKGKTDSREESSYGTETDGMQVWRGRMIGHARC